jgi:hypothetical protein
MRARQRGASLLVPVLLLITVGAFAVIVAGNQSGSDIQGSEANADSIEALFVAETGIERAIRRFMAGSACSAAGLSESITDLSTIGIASGRTLTISAGPNSGTDFNAVALAATQCRIQVTALVAGNNVSRTLQAIMDRADNFVGGPLVASFNDPAGNVAPASWSGGAYDYAGGYLAGAPVQPNCTRSGYALKAVSGAGTATATSQGSASVAFSVARPSTILATFDYRIIQVGNGSAGCTTNAGTGTSCVATNPTLDATSPSGAGNGQICMTLRDTAGANWGSTRYEALSAFNASGIYSVTTPSCLPGTQRGFGSQCSLVYDQSGGAATGRGTVRFTITAGGSGVLSVDQLTFKLHVPGGGNAYEMWLDNLILQPSTGAIAGILAWRDCSVLACPSV